MVIQLWGVKQVYIEIRERGSQDFQQTEQWDSVRTTCVPEEGLNLFVGSPWHFFPRLLFSDSQFIVSQQDKKNRNRENKWNKLNNKKGV